MRHVWKLNNLMGTKSICNMRRIKWQRTAGAQHVILNCLRNPFIFCIRNICRFWIRVENVTEPTAAASAKANRFWMRLMLLLMSIYLVNWYGLYSFWNYHCLLYGRTQWIFGSSFYAKGSKLNEWIVAVAAVIVERWAAAWV